MYANHIEYTLDTGGFPKSTIDAMYQSLDSRCPIHGFTGTIEVV
jgi:hypothetical protein